MSDTPVPLGLTPSFGFGDRIGLATPGHVEAMRRAGGSIAPIFAQQSIREMTRTNRTPEQVMADALGAAKSAGWTGRQGADADHLKVPADVDRTAAAGFCFFTIDPSDHVDGRADDYSAAELADKHSAATKAADIAWVESYKGKSIKLETGTTIAIDEATVRRAAVKYGAAVNHAVALARHIAQVNERFGRDYEIELSVDETPQPTTLAEHYIVAHRCLDQGMKLVSLAPRYVGEFEKGVDYKGDLRAFEKSLGDHAAIARLLGPYKLSLHSGSDKLSIYTPFARITKGQFHVKTAGTSYLEALRVVARADTDLFRRVVKFALSRYDTDKATYHVSAQTSDGPAPDSLDARKLESVYIGDWSTVPADTGFTGLARQILHCTFGSTLTHPELAPLVRQCLEGNQPLYTEVLADHFARHLVALGAGM
ncbi:MAG TPA: tagaturonate epimerase family protein [Tepidisphaeraceae bacterium]|nr:tagaturonate epimerase family protein [Tepidisphaeraceae bacterium]